MNSYISLCNYIDMLIEKVDGMRMWAANGYDEVGNPLIGIRTDEYPMVDGIDNLFTGCILNGDETVRRIEDITDEMRCIVRSQMINRPVGIVSITLPFHFRITDIERDMESKRVYFTVVKPY